MRAKVRRRPNGRWYVSVIGEDGTEHAHGGYRTQREAKQTARELVGDRRYVAPDGLTVAGYLALWLGTREAADISPGTRDLERVIVASYVEPHIGAVKLQELGTAHLAKLYATLAKRGGRDGKPLRGKTVRNVHGLLSKAMGDATRWTPKPLLATNPVASIEPPARDDSIERTAWEPEEAQAFLEVASGDRLAAIWEARAGDWASSR